MKIPTSVMIAGMEIAVCWVTGDFEETGIAGEADYRNCKIVIDRNAPRQLQEQTYYHELMHWVLYVMGHDLRTDENFIDLLGHFMHQVDKTAKHEE